MSDAKTSGGLLISVPESRAADLIQELEKNGEHQSKAIGTMVERSEEMVSIKVNS